MSDKTSPRTAPLGRPGTITIPIEEHAAYRVALAPLAMIAEVWAQDGLDEDRPEWRRRIARQDDPAKNVPFDEVELLSGRGGRRLLVLQDAFNARDALAGKFKPGVVFAEKPERNEYGAENHLQPSDFAVAPQPTHVPVLEQGDGMIKIVSPFPMPKMGEEYRVIATAFHSDRPGEISLMKLTRAPWSTPEVTMDGIMERRRAKPIRDALEKIIKRYNESPDARIGIDEVAPAHVALAAYDAGVVPKNPTLNKRWPFRENPGEFTNRLMRVLGMGKALIGNSIMVDEHQMLAAIRTVLIEDPPALADWSKSVLESSMISAGSPYLPMGADLFGAIWDALNGHPGEIYNTAEDERYRREAMSRVLKLMPTPDKFPAGHSKPQIKHESIHAPDCATKCREQKLHKHECDCGAVLSMTKLDGGISISVEEGAAVIREHEREELDRASNAVARVLREAGLGGLVGMRPTIVREIAEAVIGEENPGGRGL